MATSASTRPQQAEPQQADMDAAQPQAAQFEVDQVATIAGGHFLHDTFSAFLAPLLPMIQTKLGTSYAMTGSLVIFTQIPSLLNPFIGYAADRISVRYFVILAPGITATLTGLIGLAPSYAALAMLLLLSGVSIAAFHAPAPAMIARVSGKRVGTGMSIFMASGELGRTFGPIVAAAGVTWWGLDGIWRLAALGWLTSAVLYWRLHQVAARPPAQHVHGISTMMPQARRVFPVLTWIMLPKAFLAVALTTYLPIYMSDERGSGLWLAAASLTILEAAGVVGALLTGTVSDRIGRGRMLLIVLTLAPIFLIVFLVGPNWLDVAMLIALGLTAISPTPVMLAVVQDQFPDNRATANGIFMLLNFLVRALAIWGIGLLADRLGLTTAFMWSALLALLSIPAVWWLPKGAAVSKVEA